MKSFLQLLFSIAAFSSMTAAVGSAEYAPFAEMAGNWLGTGIITLDTGSTERVRCRAIYEASDDGASLRLNLKCASDSYSFEFSSDVVAKRGVLSGTWNETFTNIRGTLEGRVSYGQFNVVATSPAVTANLSLTFRENTQIVVISSDGQFSGVNLSLSRS
jgi:hypothetical protein